MPADINRDEPLPERTSYAINAHAPRMGKATSLAALHNNMDLSPCQKITFKRCNFIAGALSALVLSAVFAQSGWAQVQRLEPPPIEERRYEDNFTFKYGKSFTKDPWTWGYTKEFAERFRMPEKWIEPQMKGILAMAFRVTDVGQSVTCGLGGREDNCWPNVRCQFDIYYDNSINLPWIKEAVTRDSFLTIPMSSARYTHNPYDQIANRYNSGLVGPFPLRIGFSDDKGFSRVYPAAFLYYDREFAPSVGLISITHGACSYPFRSGNRWLDFFANKEAQDKSKDQPRSQLKGIGLVHEALVPESFMQRAEVARARDTQAQAQITTRLIREFQQRQQGGQSK